MNMPLMSMILLGLTYSAFAAAIWPMLALVVSGKNVGTGYGVMTAVQNFGFAFYPSIVGYVVRNNNDVGYETMEYLFIAMSLASLGCCLVLIGVDMKQGSVLLEKVNAKVDVVVEEVES
jgi:MFS family permease